MAALSWREAKVGLPDDDRHPSEAAALSSWCEAKAALSDDNLSPFELVPLV